MKRVLVSLPALLVVIGLMGAERAAISESPRSDSESVVTDTLSGTQTAANIPYEGYKRLMITPKVGLGESELSIDSYEAREIVHPGFSWFLGADVELGLKGRWTFASGLKLMSLNSSESLHDVKINFSRIMLQVPVGFAYRIKLNSNWRIRIGLGGMFSLGLGGKYKAGYLSYHEEKNIYGGKDGMRRVDAGIDMNIQIEYRRFLAGFYYSSGFVKPYKDFDYTSYSSFFTIGYRL